MKFAISLLTTVAIASLIYAILPTESSKAASSKIRKAIAEATTVNVYEGLPHQGFESHLLLSESKQNDTKEIGAFRFYTPAVAATNRDVLKGILSSAETIQVFRGEKECGGFHPDYAVEFSSEGGSRYVVLICFGCREIIYCDGKNKHRYDFENEPCERLIKELEQYALKRPKTKELTE